MRKIYISGGKHFTPIIQRHIESLNFEPSNVENDAVHSDIKKLIDSDAIYLASDWTCHKASLVAHKVADLHNIPCYLAQNLEFLDTLDLAIFDIHGITLDDLKQPNRKPLLVSIRTMYVGICLNQGICRRLLSIRIQRQDSEITHLHKKHQEFYKFDPNYRRMYDRIEDYIEFGIPKVVDYIVSHSQSIDHDQPED